MKFRPCIDLHQGVVKQIIGSTLSDASEEKLITNFTSSKPVSWYAQQYKQDQLTGGHIIRLGSGNDQAVMEALTAWPNGMQLGGGITDENAVYWLNAGASELIMTSFIFHNGQVHEEKLKKISNLIGKENLVLDLSCRKKEGEYWIVTNRWQQFTTVKIDTVSLDYFSRFCCEFLVHAVDVEGKSGGIEDGLLKILGNWGEIPTTYAGGIHTMENIESIYRQGNGNIDFTVGSALDIFGGKELQYRQLVQKMKQDYP